MTRILAMHCKTLALLLAAAPLHAQQAASPWQLQASGTTAELRGLSVVSDRVAWASGTRGTVLHTTDGGATWRADSVPGASALDFRDVEAFDARRAVVLSIGPGASSRIYSTADGGAHWRLRFTNTDSAAFYDCMAFWDDRHGLAVSDPVRGRYRLIETTDGGASWRALPDSSLPEANPGQAAFAASGSCLIAVGARTAYLASGGSAAVIYRSTDRGHHWTRVKAPLASGKDPQGVFSVAFRDATHGVAVGGDYTAPTGRQGTAATSDDGGRSWRAVLGDSTPHGYRSAVAPHDSHSRIWVAVGTSGTDVSTDDGARWTALDTLGFNGVAFARGRHGAGRAGWAVGPKGRVARWVLDVNVLNDGKTRAPSPPR